MAGEGDNGEAVGGAEGVDDEADGALEEGKLVAAHAAADVEDGDEVYGGAITAGDWGGRGADIDEDGEGGGGGGGGDGGEFWEGGDRGGGGGRRG